MSEAAQNHQYASRSRGHKTKGNTYKDRYVEQECPECKHNKAYKDEWKTRIAYSCMKRACRHKWYVAKTLEQIREETAAVNAANVLANEE